jgi:glycosyltransferase involved in cell wall biosynthesis
MERRPLVTAIIAAYRQPEFLNVALESAANQTYAPIEILVVDDASGEPFTRHYRLPPNARLMVHPERQAAAAVSRNTALREARGEFVAFLDQDDAWSAGKIEVQVAALQANPRAALHFVQFTSVDESLRPLARRRRRAGRTQSLASLIRSNSIHPSQVMVRRSVFDQVGLFDESIRGASDWDMWLRVAALGAEAVIDEERPLAMVRRHDGQWSRSRLMMVKACEAVMAKATRWVPEKRPDLRRLLRRKHAKWMREVARARLQAGEEMDQVWPALWRAWRMWPLDWKVYRCMARAAIARGRAGA